MNSSPIRLRAFRENDLPVVYRWHQDHDTVRLLGNVFRYRSEAEAVEHMRAWLVSSPSQVRLAIDENDRLVGMTSLLGIDQFNRTASLHLMLGEADARGKGYGAIATRAMLQHAFGDLGLARVELEVLDDNKAAQAVYLRAGFRIEGERRAAVIKDGARRSLVIMGILANEFLGA